MIDTSLSKPAKHSGLSIGTILKYKGNPLLERDEDGAPLYFHIASCTSFCDYSCNGEKGLQIAKDVEEIERTKR